MRIGGGVGDGVPLGAAVDAGAAPDCGPHPVSTRKAPATARLSAFIAPSLPRGDGILAGSRSVGNRSSLQTSAGRYRLVTPARLPDEAGAVIWSGRCARLSCSERSW